MNVDIFEAQSKFEIATAYMMVSAYTQAVEDSATAVLDTLPEDIETGRVSAVLTLFNGLPAAIGLLMPAEDGARQLRCGFTHPDCRGYGAWSATLDRHIAQCRAEGMRVWASPDPKDTRVKHALERRGFVADEPSSWVLSPSARPLMPDTLRA